MFVFITYYIGLQQFICTSQSHDDFIKWKHTPRYCPFVWGSRWPLVNSLHKGQWRRALMFSLISAWLNGRVNNHEAGDLRCHCTHYDIVVMLRILSVHKCICSLQGLYSLSGKMSCRQISWCLEAKRLDVIIIISLWNLTGISAVLLWKCLSNVGVIRKV